MENEAGTYTTLWKMNLEPENHMCEKENRFPNLHFWVPCEFSRVKIKKHIFVHFGTCKSCPSKTFITSDSSSQHDSNLKCAIERRFLVDIEIFQLGKLTNHPSSKRGQLRI